MNIKANVLVSEAKKETINPRKIDLSGISSLVNELNEIVAPELIEELGTSRKLLEEKNNIAKNKIMELKSLNEEAISLKEKKLFASKKLMIVSLLTTMHANFVINESVKKDTLTLLNDLDKFSMKRLDAQIAKLESIVKGS
mgnify:CR=1 FL=1